MSVLLVAAAAVLCEVGVEDTPSADVEDARCGKGCFISCSADEAGLATCAEGTVGADDCAFARRDLRGRWFSDEFCAARLIPSASLAAYDPGTVAGAGDGAGGGEGRCCVTGGFTLVGSVRKILMAES